MRKRIAGAAVAAFLLITGLLIVSQLNTTTTASGDEELVTAEQVTTTIPPDHTLEDYARAVTLAQFSEAVNGFQLQQFAEAWTAAHPPPPPKPKPSSTAPASSGGSGAQHTAAPPTGSASDEAFRQCVMVRESGRNYGSVGGGMYGIISSTWHTIGGPSRWGASESWLASPASQDEAFWVILAQSGRRAWSPYDGC